MALCLNLLSGQFTVNEIALIPHAFDALLQGLEEVSPEAYISEYASTSTTRITTNTIVLSPTYSCNLACTYCYQGSLGKRAVVWDRQAVDHVIDIIPSIKRQLSGSELPTDYIIIGGEVITPSNIEILTYLLEKLGALNPNSTTIITNGTYLAQYVPALSHYGKISYDVTLDGTREHHDRRRPSRKPRISTWDKTVAGINAALEHGCSTTLRTNIDIRNLSDLNALAHFISTSGWWSRPTFAAYLYPVTDDYRSNHKYASEAEVAEQLALLADKEPMLRSFRWDFHGLDMLYRLRQGRPTAPRVRYCGVEHGQITIDVDGRVSNCWFGIKSAHFTIGKVNFATKPSLSLNKERASFWRERTIDKLEPCRTCKWALMCGGGCALRGSLTGHSPHYTNCADFNTIISTCARHVFN
jgi:uncharacterized protein